LLDLLLQTFELEDHLVDEADFAPNRCFCHLHRIKDLLFEHITAEFKLLVVAHLGLFQLRPEQLLFEQIHSCLLHVAVKSLGSLIFRKNIACCLLHYRHFLGAFLVTEPNARRLATRVTMRAFFTSI